MLYTASSWDEVSMLLFGTIPRPDDGGGCEGEPGGSAPAAEDQAESRDAGLGAAASGGSWSELRDTGGEADGGPRVSPRGGAGSAAVGSPPQQPSSLPAAGAGGAAGLAAGGGGSSAQATSSLPL